MRKVFRIFYGAKAKPSIQGPSSDANSFLKQEHQITALGRDVVKLLRPFAGSCFVLEIYGLDVYITIGPKIFLRDKPKISSPYNEEVERCICIDESDQDLAKCNRNNTRSEIS